MNTIAYLIYLLLTYVITVHVGLRFYRYGRVYILRLLKGDDALTDFINKLLLTGYYLLNLGYAALMLKTWDTITSWSGMISGIATMTGKIMLILALIHFGNMSLIFLISRSKSIFLKHKNTRS